MKRRTWITTLALLVLAGGLAAFIFLVEAKREPPPEADALPTPVPLWDLAATDLVLITVSKGEQTVALERGATSWRVTEPELKEADSMRLTGMSLQIADMTATRVFADLGNLTDYGLGSETEAEVTLGLKDGTSIKFSVGSVNPGGTARYVQIEGDPKLYLVSTTSMDGLTGLAENPPYGPTPVPSPAPLDVPPETTPTPNT